MTPVAEAASPIATALERYMRERDRCLTQARRLLDLNNVDVLAIVHIAENPGIRPGQLRTHLNLTSGGITTLVDRLEQRDILRREFDRHDRRVVRLHAQIDLSVDPWKCLVRFDSAFEAALADIDPDLERDIVAVLTAATDSAELK